MIGYRGNGDGPGAGAGKQIREHGAGSYADHILIAGPVLIMPYLVVGIDANIDLVVGREPGGIYPIVVWTVLAADKQQRFSVERGEKHVGEIDGIVYIGQINLAGFDSLIEIPGMIGVDGQTDILVLLEMTDIQLFKGEGIDAVDSAHRQAASLRPLSDGQHIVPGRLVLLDKPHEFNTL